MLRKVLLITLLVGLVASPLILQFGSVSASSHREAPLISQDPLADNTDLYAFVSPDRPDTVTIIANYIPMQTPASGPGFFNFDPNVLYYIYVDNTGDAQPDVTFTFKFNTTIRNPNTFLAHLGTAGQGTDGTAGGDAVISSLNDPDFNIRQTYTVTMAERDGRVRSAASAEGIRRWAQTLWFHHITSVPARRRTTRRISVRRRSTT